MGLKKFTQMLKKCKKPKKFFTSSDIKFFKELEIKKGNKEVLKLLFVKVLCLFSNVDIRKIRNLNLVETFSGKITASLGFVQNSMNKYIFVENILM